LRTVKLLHKVTKPVLMYEIHYSQLALMAILDHKNSKFHTTCWRGWFRLSAKCV